MLPRLVDRALSTGPVQHVARPCVRGVGGPGPGDRVRLRSQPRPPPRGRHVAGRRRARRPGLVAVRGATHGGSGTRRAGRPRRPVAGRTGRGVRRGAVHLQPVHHPGPSAGRARGTPGAASGWAPARPGARPGPGTAGPGLAAPPRAAAAPRRWRLPPDPRPVRARGRGGSATRRHRCSSTCPGPPWPVRGPTATSAPPPASADPPRAGPEQRGRGTSFGHQRHPNGVRCCRW